MLNRIIRIAASALGAALLLAGCAKEPGPAPTELPVSFSAGSPLLRDDATKALLAAGTSFGVFAYYQPGTEGSPGAWNANRTPDFMYNQQVLYNGSTYTYAPTRFWPSAGNRITFWAYCPYSASPDFLKAGATTAYTSGTKKLPDIRFSVTDGTVDFMTSDLVKNCTRPGNNAPVEFTFRHALSLIDIKIDKQDPTSKYTVMLKSIRLDGICMSAILRNPSWSTWNPSWAEWSDRQNFTIFADDPSDDTDDIELSRSTPHAFDGVMLMPQSLSHEDAKLHVEYSISYAGILHERTTAYEAPLSTVFEDASSRWDKNHHYTLTLTVVPDDPIEFTVSWSDWGDDFNYHITS